MSNFDNFKSIVKRGLKTTASLSGTYRNHPLKPGSRQSRRMSSSKIFLLACVGLLLVKGYLCLSVTNNVPCQNGLGRHDVISPREHFGMPSTSNQNMTVTPSHTDQTGEDLARAANDLDSLRKDLSVTADWLRQTNHTVHSALLRALQAYVTAIERQVDHQRQLYVQTRVTGLKSEIAAIKEKVAGLTDRLRSMVPSRQHVLAVSNREDVSTSANSSIGDSIHYSATLTNSTPNGQVSNSITPTRELSAPAITVQPADELSLTRTPSPAPALASTSTRAPASTPTLGPALAFAPTSTLAPTSTSVPTTPLASETPALLVPGSTS